MEKLFICHSLNKDVAVKKKIEGKISSKNGNNLKNNAFVNFDNFDIFNTFEQFDKIDESNKENYDITKKEYSTPRKEERNGACDDNEKCPECGERDCIDMTDIATCKKCGSILYKLFDSSAEYRYFVCEDKGCDPTRVGPPQDPNLPEASLGTIILAGFGNSRAMHKIRKYHTWNIMPYKERSLIQTYERLMLTGLNHGINQSILDESKQLYVTLQEIGGRQGLSRDAMLSSCIYLTLKESGSPRKPKDVAQIFGLNSASFTKALKQVQEAFAMARQKGKIQKKQVVQESTKATEYIALPLSKLPLTCSQQERLKVVCSNIAEFSEREGLSQENMPPSLAAGCIAFVIRRMPNVSIPLVKIAEVSGISSATLQKCIKRLEGHGALIEKYIEGI
jgi:transcription initiation factor TFIIIB Brf1 subunit/transcription initiation factor TFIIB